MTDRGNPGRSCFQKHPTATSPGNNGDRDPILCQRFKDHGSPVHRAFDAQLRELLEWTDND